MTTKGSCGQPPTQRVSIHYKPLGKYEISTNSDDTLELHDVTSQLQKIIG